MEEELIEDVSVEETENSVVESDVEDTGENTQVAAEERNDQEKNWRAANKTMREQSDEIKSLRAELDKVKNPPKEKKSYFEGRDKDDFTTVNDLEAYQATREADINAKLAQLETKARYPDMDEVINKYGKQLPDSVKYAVFQSQNPYLAAYEACINSAAYYKDGMTASAQKEIKAEVNAKKPLSSGGAGKSGALNKASYYESMTEEQILQQSARYIGG